LAVWSDSCALAALASILAARKIRSRTSALDLVFPLLWLHWGNYENLLMAHQVAIVLPGCLCAIVAARVAASPTIASARSTILVGACVLALPLCGGGGVAQAPALALWLLLSGLAGWRSGGTARRSTAAILLACAALAIAFIVLYVLRFPGTQEFRRSPDLASTLATAARFSALALGAAGETVWPLSLAIVAGAVLPAAVLLASVACARTGERVRAAGLLCCMAAVASIAWSVGWARPEGGERSGFAVRYVTLPAPLLAGSVFAWLALGSPAVARWVQGALLVALAALLPLNTRAGIDFGERRSALAASFLRDVEAGLSSDELSFRHWRTMHPNPRPFAAMLALLREARLGPFRRGSWPAEIDEGRAGPYLMLEAQPLRVFPPALVMPRKAGGRDVLMAPPESELVFEIPPGAHSLRGVFGIAPESYTRARRSTDGVRFVVEMRRQGQAPQELPELLFERLLEPQGRREDRGFQSLCVDLPEGARGTLVLRTLNDPGMDRRGDLAFWTELAFD